MVEFDTVIEGGRVLDCETGTRGIFNVGISGGRIAAVTPRRLRGRKRIDATGLVVSPGFIDVHTHEDDSFSSAGRGGDISLSPFETARAALACGVTTLVGGNCGHSSFPVGAHLARWAGRALPCNYGTLVGYGAVRRRVLGERKKVPGAGEMERIRGFLEESLEAGALGVSFGLQYCPDIRSEEILAAAKIARRRNRFLAFHLRYDYPARAAAAFEEIAALARTSGVAVQISHLAANIYGEGQPERTLAAMEELRQGGVDIMADVYPYDAWGTGIKSEVFSRGWRRRYAFSYEDIEVVGGEHGGRRCTPALFGSLRRRREDTFVVCHGAVPEAALRTALASGLVMAASDGSLRRNPVTNLLEGHPRGAGTAPRLLGRLVRERGWLSLEAALAKLTLLPARRLNLAGKGRLQVGADADLAVFDPDTVIDASSFGAGVCAAPPRGVEFVLVGGEVACEGGRLLRDDLGGILLPAPPG
jgi:N-acyl-D-amino-acid deacylase